MVFQIKDAGEAGAGKFRFGPRAIRLLAIQQEPDGPKHSGIIGPASGHQAQ